MQEDNQTNESALELRLKQITRYVTLGLLVILAICALLFVYIGSVKQNEQAAISNTQVQADQTKDSDTCKVYPNQELCVLARKIAADPTQPIVPKDGEKGDKGDTGPTGRGVVSFQTDKSGDLIVAYTDGQVQNAGRVVGKDGTAGVAGADGRGILSTALKAGNLVINYTDGTSQDVGMVVGPQGVQGVQGETGKTGATGPVGPQGEPGSPGRSIVDLQVDNTNTVVVYYSDNTSSVAGKLTISTIKSMVCNQDTDVLTITMTDGSYFAATVDCTPDKLPAPAKTTAPLVKTP